jgi:stage IV sporulation protein FB
MLLELISIKGCRVSVSLYFAVFIACILVLDHTGLTIFALLCAAFHEMGHIVTISALKVPVCEINFKLFGINIKLRNNIMLGFKQEILIALSGCIANAVLCIGALIAINLNFYSFYANYIFVFSLILAGFNIIPITPLDGGRALSAFLCVHFQYNTVEKITNVLSFIFIVPLGAMGVILLFKTGYNFSLIAAAIYLATSIILNKSMFIKNKQVTN